jgi:hypothetical protein
MATRKKTKKAAGKGASKDAFGCGSCMWYWNGNAWQGPMNNCMAGCRCPDFGGAGHPPNPPAGTPPFFQPIPCTGGGVRGGACKPRIVIRYDNAFCCCCEPREYV